MRILAAAATVLAGLSFTTASAQAGPEAGDFQFPGADTTNNGDTGYVTFGASAGKRFVPFSFSGTPTEVGTSGVVNGDAMPNGPGKWAGQQSAIWTPSPYYDPATRLHFLFYTATKEGTAGPNPRKCIGAAYSTQIAGPYQDVGQPLACPNTGSADNPRWALDADVVAGDGRVYMTWRDGQRAVGGQSALSVTTVGFQPDGVVRRTAGARVLYRSNQLPWAQRNGKGVTVIENPTAVFNAGSWYLFYSGNSFQTDKYATGIAYCGPKLGASACQPMPGPKKAYFSYAGKRGLPNGQRLFDLPGNKRGPGAMDVYRLLDGTLGVTWNYITDASPQNGPLTRLSKTGHLQVTGTGPNAQFKVVGN